MISELILLISWKITRRIPCFKKNEIGILIAIKTDNEKVKIRLKNDFIKNITNEMKSVSSNISILTLSEYHCEKLENSNNKNLWQKYHYKSKAKLIIAGYADTRSHLNQDCYYLKLEESVSHSPIGKNISQVLVNEMINSFPRETLIPLNDEFFGFKLVSNLFGIASKYILGIACIYSSNFELALNYHLSLLAYKYDENTNIPNIKKLLQNTKSFVSQEAVILARCAYLQNNNLSEMKRYLEISKKNEKSINYFLLNGINSFLLNNDLKTAKQSILEAKKLNNRDYTWAYSMGFLLAYEGDLSEAYHYYKLAFNNITSIATHIECEIFLRNIIEREPGKIQLWYCLGLIYYFSHEDYILAKDSFIEFKNKAIESKHFLDIIKYVDSYLDRIEKKLCTN